MIGWAVQASLMAENFPGGDGVPTWLTALLSVGGTLASWWAWRPIGHWVSKRLDIDRQTRTAERFDLVSQLKTQLTATVAEMLQLRLDLGTERELRMAAAIENAGLRRDVEHLTKQIAEDKRECQVAIRGLRAEIAELRKQRGTF